MKHIIAWALADEDGSVIDVSLSKAPLVLSAPKNEVFPLYEFNLKPIEFEKMPGFTSTYEAVSPFGSHQIWESPSGWYFRNPWHGVGYGPHKTREMAEQGAFLDYSLQVEKCFK